MLVDMAKLVSGRGWWMDAKMYELYVDKFAGTFKGLTAKLDYFTHLGINTLHILPHYPSPMVDDGYDISNYEDVRSALGTLGDFVAFTDAAHQRGIRVLTDLVINHVSAEHLWFKEARASTINFRRDFFHWSKTGTEYKGALNPFVDFKPSNWIWNEATQDYYYATFYPDQPDLNWNNPHVLEEILARIDFWVERGVDGFRLDAIPFLVEKDGTSSLGLPETHRIIRTIRAHLDRKYDNRVALLAEVGSSADEARKYFGDGDECQIIYHFPLAAKMLLSLKRGDDRPIHEIGNDLRDVPEDCRWAVFLRNHDEISMVGLTADERMELLDFLDPERRYSFHNGETTALRLGSIFSNEQKHIVRAFELLYSLPSMPIMYYGDEIGMQNLPLNDDVVDTRKYVRGNFDWQVAEKMLVDPDSLLNKTATIIYENRTTS